MNKIIPKKGVYAVKVRINGSWFNGMMNIGIRPTFDGDQQTLEVHLFNFDEDIYGKEVQVRFFKRIRDEKKFGGKQELIEQLKADKEHSQELLSKH